MLASRFWGGRAHEQPHLNAACGQHLAGGLVYGPGAQSTGVMQEGGTAGAPHPLGPRHCLHRGWDEAFPGVRERCKHTPGGKQHPSRHMLTGWGLGQELGTATRGKVERKRCTPLLEESIEGGWKSRPLVGQSGPTSPRPAALSASSYWAQRQFRRCPVSCQ